MAKFTPEEILAKVAAGERIEGVDLRGAHLGVNEDECLLHTLPMLRGGGAGILSTL